MWKRKHTVVICVDVMYHLEIQRFVDVNVKTIGVIDNHVDEHKSFTVFDTKMDTATIAKQLRLLVKNVITIGDIIIEN